MKLGMGNDQYLVCCGQTNVCWMNKQDSTHNPTLQSDLHNAGIHKVLNFIYIYIYIYIICLVALL